MTRVLFVGESWSVTSIHTKGFDSFTTTAYEEGGAALLEALGGDEFDVTYMPCHVAVKDFPDSAAKFADYDVVLFSDIGANSLLLPAPTFLKGRSTPNRLELLRDWVHGGGGFGMIGGYLSFQGIEGKANYRNTCVADILPVEMIPGDDRVEAPQGVRPQLVGDSPVAAGLEQEWPAVLGYQRLLVRPTATVVATVGEDPLLVTGEFGAGRVLAFSTDVGDHWAPSEFVGWPGFARIWRQGVRWLSGSGQVSDSVA